MRATILPKARRTAVSNGQGVYCGLSASIEVSLNFTTQLKLYVLLTQYFSCTDKWEVLQQGYSQPPILPSPHFRWVAILYLFLPLTSRQEELIFTLSTFNYHYYLFKPLCM